ncbi:hypothetical protein J2S15_002923 [Breznakia pachnodae]|uniref:Ribosomal protein S15 n=1 Tax=Breznakia pachnodae TaxID=265178 RepID=A0ABU0E5M2_9FIRM|nr:hypothetical protein [Breznakia pachnodae]
MIINLKLINLQSEGHEREDLKNVKIKIEII